MMLELLTLAQQLIKAIDLLDLNTSTSFALNMNKMHYLLLSMFYLMKFEAAAFSRYGRTDPSSAISILPVSEPETFILLGAGMVIAALIFQLVSKKST